jgi:hypothetical protein
LFTSPSESSKPNPETAAKNKDSQDHSQPASEGLKTPVTLLQIGNGIDPLFPQESWVKQGNVLILLGVKPRATKAPFTSDVDSPEGKIRIETSRRSPLAIQPNSNQSEPASQPTSLLNDSFGAIVWQQTVGKGRIIFAATPYLAANAYQDFRANYEFLAKLVMEPGYPVWVDEYLHGHKAPPPPVSPQDKNGQGGKGKGRTGEGKPDLLGYLRHTPLALIAIQTTVLLAVLLWGQNRRFGPPTSLTAPVVDNTDAYIQALAGVLNKAGCSEFVLEMIGKTEQLEIQRALGLGSVPLPLDTLIAAWQQQTGRPAEELRVVLRPSDRQQRISETDLLQWIENVQTIRQHLPKEG